MAERPPKDTPPAAPPPATELYQGRYELGPILGRGGTCTVNRAWDTRLQRYVAIKRLLPPLSEDEHARARFNREGRAIARLSHPNLVMLIDRGSTESEEYLVFEYVEGRSLKDLVRAEGAIAIRDALNIAGQVAEGLAQAHLAGIVHRDVKPQNILLDAEGRAKLTDFGIATGADWTKVTRAGTIVGSSRYMSPEQVQSRPVDARSDIYSLGIVLYELLCGRPPFDGNNLAEIGRQHVKQKPPRPSELRAEIPPQLERVLLRCLEKLPENRFQSMDELMGALVGLDYYSLERSPGGLLDGLRRRAQSLKEGATDPSLWLPNRRGEAETGQGAAAAGAGAGRKAEERATTRARRAGAAGRRRTLALAGALILGLVAVAIAGVLLLGGAETAPDLIGKSLDEAQELADSAGLSLEVDSEQIPAEQGGIVQEQTPAPGAEAAGGVITVQVTRAYETLAADSLDDSDPEGDEEERPDLLEALSDGSADTSWSTELYRTESFGNLKQGVGVVFELPQAASVIVVNSPDAGWRGEVQDRRDDGSFVKVADLTGENEQRVVLEQALTAGRIWITALVPGENDRFRVRLSELAFLR